MPQRNDDLFRRLRRAGVRKPVAKALSELTEDAGKKAAAAGHRAVAELRALADEIEKRLPPPPTALATQAPPVSDLSAPVAPAPVAPAPVAPAPLTVARTRTRTPRTTTKTPSAARPRKAPVTSSAARPRKAPAASSATSSSPAPRGENKTKILSALKSGPRTASEISQETGIATATVSAALTRLSKAGEVTKATRGYALPN